MTLRGNARLLIAVAAVALVALVAAACGTAAAYSGGGTASSPAAPSGSGAAVAISNYAFSPQTLTVKAGTTVTWTNNDSVPHDVTSASDASTGASKTGLFTSGTLGQGQSFSYTFDKAGTYYYECSIHAAMAGMHGTVVVQ